MTIETIEPDVLVARGVGLDPALLQAVVNAEGDIVRAVQCSLPSVTTREEDGASAPSR